MNVALTGELLEEVECSRYYLGSYIAVGGGLDGEVKFESMK